MYCILGHLVLVETCKSMTEEVRVGDLVNVLGFLESCSLEREREGEQRGLAA